MAVSLFTVRIVLQALGAVDYGLYNVVGGVVTMFSFLSGSMATASQRFFAFELGKENHEQLKKTFSMIMMAYVAVAALILLLAETLGLWLLDTQLNIPTERVSAAHWVYQFSVFSFMMSIITIPYRAAIIAHERMDVFAWISILEVLLKLLVAYLLIYLSFDALKLYAVLVFGVTTLVTLVVRTYAYRRFEECRFSYYWDSRLFKEIVGYSGWNLFGAAAAVSRDQGVNIILNMFFGPTVNAARGIAFQVNMAINQFVQNFMIATRPQITKYYASEQNSEMLELVFRSSKFCFFLLFIISTPLLAEAQFVLATWLTTLPEHAVTFTRLILLSTLINSLSLPLMAAAQATGRIAMYQAVVGSVVLLNLPIAYLLLSRGLPAETVFYTAIAISTITLFLRLLFLRSMVNLSIRKYLSQVLLRALLCVLFTYSVLTALILHTDDGVLRFFLSCFTSVLISVISIYVVGLSSDEKVFVSKSLKRLIAKLRA
ncbi:lipopolysaccharide biosynthesis protein [Mangrovimicrobium sediminis]|nr:lipopolysaccharide biosynthesis protein [Haliea sp. SAOS-164]